MGKVKTALKVASNVATKPVEVVATKESNNLLLIGLIIGIWLYLFFKKG